LISPAVTRRHFHLKPCGSCVEFSCGVHYHVTSPRPTCGTESDSLDSCLPSHLGVAGTGDDTGGVCNVHKLCMIGVMILGSSTLVHRADYPAGRLMTTLVLNLFRCQAEGVYVSTTPTWWIPSNRSTVGSLLGSPYEWST